MPCFHGCHPFCALRLINEAEANVTLTQEVETLKLYLDIEKMRFEERLRTDFEIDPAAANAMIPSLLLQPLVENAIKYAVTPQEEGADITIRAQLAGDRVRIIVSDTGPGLQQGAVNPKTSTGVGMVNIRERLTQAYGEEHRFDTYTREGQGFEAVIEFPFQVKPSGAAAGITGASAVSLPVTNAGAIAA